MCRSIVASGQTRVIAMAKKKTGGTTKAASKATKKTKAAQKLERKGQKKSKPRDEDEYDDQDLEGILDRVCLSAIRFNDHMLNSD